MSKKPQTPRVRRSSSDSATHSPEAAELEALKAQVTRLQQALNERERASDEIRLSTARFRAFAEHATDAFFLHDEQDVLLEVNRQACESLGYTREELIGMTPYDFDADVTPEILQQIHVRLVAGETVTFEARHRRKDGSSLPVEVRIRSFWEEGHRFAVAVIRDITERKQAEAALQERERHSQSLLRLSKALENAQTYDQVLAAVLDEVQAILGYQNFWVYLLSDDKRQATLLTAGGNISAKLLGDKQFVTMSITGDPMLEAIAAAREIVVVPDARTDERTNKEWVAYLGNRTLVNIPIMLLDRHLGSAGTGTFGHEDVRVPSKAEEVYLSALASHLAVTLDRLHLLEQRRQADRERQAHLLFLESLDRFNRAIQSSDNQDQMMTAVLDGLLSIFECDRAWFVYPCDPESPTWQVPMERTRPAYPGVLPIGVELPLDAVGADVFRLLRESPGPVQFGPGSNHPVPIEMAQGFKVQSLIAMALYPKIGCPWSFGLHQCTYARVWTPAEERLFQEIGRRLGDALSSLLMHRRLQESEERYRLIAENTAETITVFDLNLNAIYISPSIQKLRGFSSQEALTHSIDQVLTPDSLHRAYAALAENLALETSGTADPARTVLLELQEYRKDGSTVWVELSASLLRDTDGKATNILTVTRDISERKQAQVRILRLNRLYATLSQINQAIVHARDRATLFQEICRVAVEHGQFRLAWIGWIDATAGRLEPVAFAGEEHGYLAELNISTRDDPAGRGITGTAVREGHCVLCQDIAIDPRMELWSESALQHGYRSVAAVPFRRAGRVVGALTVYTGEPDGFDAEDEQLLDEIGQDISFALDMLEQEAQRRAAETELNRLNAELEERVSARTSELASAHAHLRAILDTVGEGIVFTDPKGGIEYINPAMERLTGFGIGEVIGQNPRLWKSGQTPPDVYARMWSVLRRGEIWQGELINRRKDGRLYDVALTAAPLTNVDGQIVGFVGVQRDVTRQKELDRLKDQFVSNVSHELRTPISNILLHLGLVERGRPERRDFYLQTLRREAERLRKMIEDLLDLSRLDRTVAPVQFAPTDLNQLLGQMVTDRTALAQERGLTLTFEPAPDLPLISTDPSKISQVASNLLTNALNYTPAGGTVKIWTAVYQLGGQPMAAFTVRDSGPGITAQDRPHLFERFYRGVAGRRASAPGTGLGLAISHDLIERLGGHITVESEVEHGAAFTVWLPLSA